PTGEELIGWYGILLVRNLLDEAANDRLVLLRPHLWPPPDDGRTLHAEHAVSGPHWVEVMTLLEGVHREVGKYEAVGLERRMHSLQAGYGQPSPGAGASAMSIWPVRGSANMFSGPLHSLAIMKTVRQTAVRTDAECRQSLRVGFADDQRLVVPRHEHAVGEGEAVCDLPRRAVRRHQRDHAGCERLPGHQVEAAAVDVGVASPVHDQLVPRRRARGAAQVAMRHQTAVGLSAQEEPFARRHD